MTDLLELALREELGARASAAPEPVGLAAAAIGRAREQRRRHALWGTAATLVVVLTLGAAVLVVGRDSTTTPVSPAASASPVETSDDQLAFDGVLHYLGAQVPVPKAWLHTDNLACHSAIRDAAYVAHPDWGHNLCAPPIDLDQSELTEVVLTPWRDGAGPASGEHVLPDGRTQLVTRVPAADLRFVVTSPDAGLARRIFDGLDVNASGNCSDVWLTSSRGDTARMGKTPGESTLTVHVGDMVMAQSNGPCPSLGLSLRPDDGALRPQLIAPVDGTTAGTALIADKPGTVRVTAMAAMCDGLGPECAGGVALLGSVDVTVVADD